MTGMAHEAPRGQHKKRTLKPWQVRTVAGVVGLIAVALAAYAAAASYESVSHLAASRGVPLPSLNPLGIDGGLAGVILFSIALYWISKPVRWLRVIARLFAAGTVAANLAAGWPDPVSMGLRCAAPVLFVVLVEATYALLVHRDDDDDPIPLARWILAPRPTFRMWRRMKLWRIRSYRDALAMELSRIQATMKLTALYAGKDWREAAPEDLVWMLTEGVRMDEALTRVAELTRPEGPAPAPGTAGSRKGGTTGRRKGDTVARKPVRHKPGTAAPEPAVPDDVDTQAEALRILAEKPGISGSELGRRLGKTPGYGRTLMRRLAKSVADPEAR